MVSGSAGLPVRAEFVLRGRCHRWRLPGSAAASKNGAWGGPGPVKLAVLRSWSCASLAFLAWFAMVNRCLTASWAAARRACC